MSYLIVGVTFYKYENKSYVTVKYNEINKIIESFLYFFIFNIMIK